jgi:hypothetical protein
MKVQYETRDAALVLMKALLFCGIATPLPQRGAARGARKFWWVVETQMTAEQIVTYLLGVVSTKVTTLAQRESELATLRSERDKARQDLQVVLGGIQAILKERQSQGDGPPSATPGGARA